MRESERRVLTVDVGLGLLIAGAAWAGAHLRWARPPQDVDGPFQRGRDGGPGWPEREPPFTAVDVSWVAVPFLLLLAGGVALRWFHPRLAFLLAVTGVGGFFASTTFFGPALLAPALVVYAMAAKLPSRRWVALTALLVPMIMAAHLREAYLGLLGPGLYAGLFGAVAVVVLPALLALLQRSRRDAELRQRQDDRRRYAYEERLRIAREVHDVVGHSLSVVTMQAGVALHLLEKQRSTGSPPPVEVTESLEAIRRTSREALADLRTTLAVFRDPAPGEPRAPQAGLARLDDLVEALRQAGRRIELVRETTGEPLPAAVDAAAFRIIQEGLTNVVRHAGEAAATVALHQAEDRLVIEVVDDGEGSPRLQPGNGIRGMRERAHGVGGSVSLTARPAGGVLLRAELPLTAVPVR